MIWKGELSRDAQKGWTGVGSYEPVSQTDMAMGGAPTKGSWMSDGITLAVSDERTPMLAL